MNIAYINWKLLASNENYSLQINIAHMSRDRTDTEIVHFYSKKCIIKILMHSRMQEATWQVSLILLFDKQRKIKNRLKRSENGVRIV